MTTLILTEYYIIGVLNGIQEKLEVTDLINQLDIGWNIVITDSHQIQLIPISRQDHSS